MGTVLHEFAAICVEFGVDPWGMVGARYLDRELTREMASKMLPGLDLIQSLTSHPDTVLLVEKRVDLSPWLGKGQSGTSDVIVIDPTARKMTVLDWKFGAGVPVHPKNNDQGMLYALGAWHDHARHVLDGTPPERVTVDIVIEQPLAPGGGGLWTTSMSDLLREGRAIRRDADRTRDPDAPYNPGDKQCQFCPAARHNVCKARSQWIVDALGVDLDDDEISLVDRRALTPEQRSLILLNQKLITRWLTQLYEEAMDDALKGRPVPGMKRVAGRAGRRRWIDEALAAPIVVELLGEDDAYVKTLLTPAKVEDEVGRDEYRDRLSRLVEQAPPGVALVPEDDPKPALRSAEDLLDL